MKAMFRRAVVTAGVAVAPCLVSVSAASAASSDLVASSDVCSKVSRSAVSAIVGHGVPAAAPMTSKVPAKDAGGISLVDTACIYQSFKSTAAVRKGVNLVLDTASKPWSYSSVVALLTDDGKNASNEKVLSRYSGLGVPGVYFVQELSPSKHITVYGIAGFSGRRLYSANVYTSSLPKSKIAQLAKLAAKLG